MARAQYNSWLYVWADGDNPGAGSQSVDSTGLNGNWIKLSDAFKAEHDTPGGTHKASSIKRQYLDGTTADKVIDGASLEKDASVGIRIKAYASGTDGVQKSHLNPNVADASTIEKDAGVGLRIKDAGVTGAKLAAGVVDATTIEISANALRIKDDGVTAPKISHDNNRTKTVLQFTVESVANGTYAKFGGLQTTASYGPSMPRAGSITRMQIKSSTGGTDTKSANYGVKTFAAGDILSLLLTDSPITIEVIKNGSGNAIISSVIGGSTFIVLLELEFDD